MKKLFVATLAVALTLALVAGNAWAATAMMLTDQQLERVWGGQLEVEVEEVAVGVDGSAAIINHPEAAMLGIGRLVERPWVVDGALAVRTVTELTISFDHRVCDGAEAAAFRGGRYCPPP